MAAALQSAVGASAGTDLVVDAARAAWDFVEVSEAWLDVSRSERLRAADDPSSTLGRAWARLRVHLDSPFALVEAIATRLELPDEPDGPHDLRARAAVSHNLGNIVPTAWHGSAVRLARLLTTWSTPGPHRIVALPDGTWTTRRGVALHDGTVDAVRITVRIG